MNIRFLIASALAFSAAANKARVLLHVRRTAALGIIFLIPFLSIAEERQLAFPQSEARQAMFHAAAVAEEQNNSLIVSAPGEAVPRITDVTSTRTFQLQHADATEMAELITSLYNDTRAQNSQRSERSGLLSKVAATGDPRTNSILITAAQDSMLEISELIASLDAKRQRVHVYQFTNADPAKAGMFTKTPAYFNGAIDSPGPGYRAQAAQVRTAPRVKLPPLTLFRHTEPADMPRLKSPAIPVKPFENQEDMKMLPVNPFDRPIRLFGLDAIGEFEAIRFKKAR